MYVCVYLMILYLIILYLKVICLIIYYICIYSYLITFANTPTPKLLYEIRLPYTTSSSCLCLSLTVFFSCTISETGALFCLAQILITKKYANNSDNGKVSVVKRNWDEHIVLFKRPQRNDLLSTQWFCEFVCKELIRPLFFASGVLFICIKRTNQKVVSLACNTFVVYLR